ncbi:O-antigen ligase family protein [Brevundimonas subvibrioides]|uniref:O-antigen ligase family protein n=1 Tax=Brevundimonas subvibrioides TaxID=74313 RepID=UPI0032D583F7
MRPALESPPAEDLAPPLWERAAAMFVVIMLTGAFVGPVFAPTQAETPILRLIWLPVYAIIIALVALRADRVARAWPALLMVLALVLHAYASKYWSIDAETTARRVLAMGMASVFAVYLGVVFRGVHLPRLLMGMGLILGVGSLVFVFAFPAIGVHHGDNDGLWRGLWYEKNQMGGIMVAGAAASAACLASEQTRHRWLPFIALLVTTLLVLATQSKTSLLCLLLAVGLIAGLWAMRRGGAAFSVVAIWVGVVLIATGTYVFITEPAVVLKALGKDPSLTGRTDIWVSLMHKVSVHPWTGYGYQAFWGRESVPAMFVRAETGWPVPSAHNGWIDLLVQLGWPGAFAVGIVVAVGFFGSVFRVATDGPKEGWWALGYFLAFLLLSLSESVLLSHANLPWVLMLAIVARATAFAPDTSRVPLAPAARGAYQQRPRIAAHSAHARQRAVPVR